MLENKDYCDHETAWELCALGYPGTALVLLYSAQKWLREEKNIIVEVFVDDDSDTPITYNIYKDGECVCHHHGKYWSVKEWNEVLSEGIKEAVKILKDEQTN